MEDNRRNIGQCLYIINDSRLIKQSALKGERRFLAGLASASFNGGEKRGLLTTDEGAGSDTDFQIEGKTGSQDIAAQESGFPCLGDGIGQTLHGQRIFGPDIDEALGGADGVTAYHHALDNAVGVAFQKTAVHERAGVALIGVADHVFDAVFGNGFHAGIPLDAGGESGSAPSPEAGGFYLLHHVGLAHGEKGLADGLIAVSCDVRLHGGKFHAPAVAQGDADLAFEEVNVVQFGNAYLLVGVVEGVLLADFPIYQMAGHHVGSFLRCHGRVENAAGFHQKDRPRGAGSHTSGDNHVDGVLQAVGFQGLL